MQFRNAIIGIFISLTVTGIVIRCTNGRIDRNNYIKIKSIILLCLFVYSCVSIFLYKHRFGLLVVIGISVSPVLIFQWMRLTILRLHDLNLSGWYILFQYVPIANLYYLCILLLKKTDVPINEYDVSIDYVQTLKKLRLDSNIHCIKKCGKDFSIDDIEFTYRRDNGIVKIQCSKMELEQNPHIETYMMNNLENTENASGYGREYKISFLYTDELFNKIKKDLNAILIKDNFLILNESEILIRKNMCSYQLVYRAENIPESLHSFRNYTELRDYRIVNLKKEDLRRFFEENI